jgi:hypothetical protein
MTAELEKQAAAADKASKSTQHQVQTQQRAAGIISTFGQISGTQLDLGVLGKLPPASLLEQVGTAWQAVSDKIAGSIGNIWGAFDELANKSKVSFADVSKAIHGGLADVKSFGRDLTTISRDAKAGIPGAQDLLQHLIDMGPAGVKMADAIAGATPKARRALERDIGGAMKTVKTVSDSITRALVGSMERVAAAIMVATGQAQTFGQALAMLHSVNVNVTANTDAAYTNVRDFIAWANSQSAHVNIYMDQYTALHGRASGGGQAGGNAYPHHPLLVGEQGPEVFRPSQPGHIVPNPNLAWGSGAAVKSSNLIMVKGRLSIDDSGQAYIRGLAREETSAELRYRRLA